MIFLSMLGLMLLLSVGVRIFHVPVATRKCPVCETKVELGRQRCQVCGYRFFDRFGASGR